MKKILLLLVLMAAAASVFAAGTVEKVRPEARQRTPFPVQGEAFTVTGQVTFANKMHPKLTSGKDSYYLMVPRFYSYDIDVTEGQTITVEGYKVDREYCPWEAEGNAEFLLVSKAAIDGKEYEVEPFSGPGMRGGRRPGYGAGTKGGPGMRGGMRPGYGPGRGW